MRMYLAAATSVEQFNDYIEKKLCHCSLSKSDCFQFSFPQLRDIATFEILVRTNLYNIIVDKSF